MSPRRLASWFFPRSPCAWPDGTFCCLVLCPVALRVLVLGGIYILCARMGGGGLVG